MRNRRFGLSEARKRYSYLFLLFMVLACILAGRLLWVQIISGTRLGKQATYQITDQVRKNAPRGRILDVNGEELAVSIMANTLIANPKDMVEPKAETSAQAGGKDGDATKTVKPAALARDMKRDAARLLAPVLNMPEEELYQDFQRDTQYVRLARAMDPPLYAQVKQIIADNHLRGFYFEQESKRYYTKKSMAAQVLGFVGEDDRGMSGLELALDSILKGAVYQNTAKVDAAGNPVGDSGLENEANRIKVSSVYLTLDSKMQFVVEDALDDAILRTNSAGAAVIIMDPYTGAILAMGSRPTFDPNYYGKYVPESWLNKAISIVYEPGSVFKPIVGCMGLTEGLITPDTLINDAGSIAVADRVIRNWDGEGMGMVPFEDVIKFSINTGMVQLGLKLGAEREIGYSRKFGFGKATGIELPGEEDGILYNPQDMYEPDIATFAIGQGLAVTPLQELRAICAIANGGELVQPYIIDKIVAPNGEVIRRGKKKVLRRVLTPEVAEQMCGMMEKVVSEGGGKNARIKGYKIAGKTGTAEKLAPEGGYAEGQYMSSFVGFVPADKPLYAMLVMLDRPQGAFYGSQVSAPIFRDTLQQILVAKGVQPQNSEGLPSFDAHMKDGEKPLLKPPPELTQEKDGKWKVPNLAGHDMRTLVKVLEKGQLKLVPHGSGVSWRQNPLPGAVLAPGDAVEVWFQ